MSIVITAYSKDAFKEFFLPALEDEDFELVIDDKLFRLSAALRIQLEAIGSQWYVKNDNSFFISLNQKSFERQELKQGDVLLVGGHREEARVALIVSESKNSVRAFEKFSLAGIDEITIGSDTANIIQYKYLNLISSDHAILKKGSGNWQLIDKSRNGTFVGNKRVTGNYVLRFGDVINIFGLRLLYLEDRIAVDTLTEDVSVNRQRFSTLMPNDAPAESQSKRGSKTESFSYFKRSPRTIGKLLTEPFEIEAPPPPQKQKKQPLILTIGPAFTMVIPMLLGVVMSNSASFSTQGLWVSGGAAVFAVVWALLRVNHAKKELAADELYRVEQYRIYLDKNEQELQKQTKYNATVLHERYPDAEVCSGYIGKRHKLWNRNVTHSDFLFTRLGIGSVLFQAPIMIPKERFSLLNDELANRPRELKERYERLQDVPVGIDLLEKKLVGIFGTDSRERIVGIARSMAVQLAANNCYTDVKMVFLYNEEEQEVWEFAKWLPHVWAEGNQVRFVASNKSEARDVLYSLTGILRERTEALRSITADAPRLLPHFIVFVAAPELLENEAVTKYLYHAEQVLGISTIVLSESYEELPNDCVDLIECDNQFAGMYDVSMMDEERGKIAFDTISLKHIDKFARKLSNLRVKETESGGEIPVSLTFMDMYSADSLSELNVLERWRKNRTYESMKALVGQGAGGNDVYLDIHEKYHGPHGLVAGTTGSGKSETLQTFMLSLAMNYSPQDLGFCVIDFKGGGMANLFDSLPHMLGQITNLSGNQVRRAMVSIKSEINRRQQIFNQFGVNHIDQYTRLVKAKEASIPIPHLLIIIDEFAELKREEPDFMQQLISVAQVGRAGGIHLILATQKPAGVVDDNIWSNSKFKLCLRVQDKQDSNDMLRKPDAAFLTQAGRCYLQVGNDEIFELFQSGWSGAAYDDDAQNMRTETAYIVTTTGKLTEGKKHKHTIKAGKRKQWLAGIVGGILAAEQESTAPISSSPNVSYCQQLADDAITIYEQRGIDYPKTTASLAQLAEIVRLVLSIKAADESLSTVQIAVALVAQAEKMGLRLPEEKERTQLNALVEHISKVAKGAGADKILPLWKPLLPELLYWEELDGAFAGDFSKQAWTKKRGSWELSVPIGQCDDPVNQAQFPAIVDFAKDGHLALCGTVLSGKSTFLQTLLYALCMKYSPDELNLYCVDFSNKLLLPFAEAPHTGGVVTEENEEKLSKLFVMIAKELNRRKQRYQGGGYAQYVRAHDTREPAIIYVIDGYANFREKTDNNFESDLITLSREGAAYGMYLILSSAGFGGPDIQNRIADNIKSVFCMEMGDKFKYADVMHTMHIDVLPEANIKGRGLMNQSGSILEFQTALPMAADNDFARAEMVKGIFKKMRSVWSQKAAARIPEIPADPTWELFAKEDAFRQTISAGQILPLGYREKDADICGISLKNCFSYLIAGKMRTGKSNALKIALLSAAEMKGKLTIVDSNAQSLKVLSQKLNATYVTTDEDYTAFGNTLMQEVVKRNQAKGACKEEGLDDNAIFEKMQEQFEPYFIFIDNLTEFVQRIYTKKEGVQDISGFLENFAEKGSLHNIYIIACYSTEDYGKVAGKRLFDIIASYRLGLLLGGNAAEQKLFNFSGMSYQEQTKTYRAGIALIPGTGNAEPSKVILPLVRG